LITFGAFLILEDVQQLIWGTSPYTGSEVVDRLGTAEFFAITYTNYQMLFIPMVALTAYGLLQYLLRYTRIGKQIIAVTHNAEVATALGIHAKRIRLVTFVVGAILGALGGALAAPTTSLVPGAGSDMIVLSFSVVATAGLGQIMGARAAAVMIGLARQGFFSVAQARRL